MRRTRRPARHHQGLRERLIALKLKHDELGKEIADLSRHLTSDDPAITPEEIGQLVAETIAETFETLFPV